MMCIYIKQLLWLIFVHIFFGCPLYGVILELLRSNMHCNTLYVYLTVCVDKKGMSTCSLLKMFEKPCIVLFPLRFVFVSL